MFEHDKLLRNAEGVPIGRVVLTEKGFDPESEMLAIAVLKAPKVFFNGILGKTVWVDNIEYVIPRDLHPLKVGGTSTDYLVNSFFLERLKRGDGKA